MPESKALTKRGITTVRHAPVETPPCRHMRHQPLHSDSLSSFGHVSNKMDSQPTIHRARKSRSGQSGPIALPESLTSSSGSKASFFQSHIGISDTRSRRVRRSVGWPLDYSVTITFLPRMGEVPGMSGVPHTFGFIVRGTCHMCTQRAAHAASLDAGRAGVPSSAWLCSADTWQQPGQRGRVTPALWNETCETSQPCYGMTWMTRCITLSLSNPIQWGTEGVVSSGELSS